MDAFSVSVVRGLVETDMKNSRMTLISGTFAVFQFIMPMIGYFAVSSLVGAFDGLVKAVPFLAFILLLIIGGKMVFSAMVPRQAPEEYSGLTEAKEDNKIGFLQLLTLGFATSIDALSAGFTLSSYTALQALIAALIIGLVTFFVCLTGILLGKKIGDRFSKKAELLGGCILIAIGIESLIKGVLALL